VQRIENKAKTFHCHVAHSNGATWRPDPTQTRPDLDPTRPGQTPVSTTVDRWSGGSPRWSAIVDRRWPPLTVVGHRLSVALAVASLTVPRQMVRVRGEGSVVGSKGSFGGSEGSKFGSSCVRGRTFQANHWHLMRRLALLKDQNTLVSWALIGWRSEWTKIPLRGLGFKLRRSSSFWDSLGVG
ncbi:hypothetical protein Tco_1120814, partial [Tanacetum coccineum]